MHTKSANNIPTVPVTRKAAARITKQLLMFKEGDPEYSEAFETAQRWRAQHALAAENCFRVLVKAAAGYPSSVLTFRLKRMKSILAKIRRPNSSYQLGTMDDIGGCRLVLSNMVQLDDAINSVERSYVLKNGNSKKNYIESPRMSGYRSFHLVTVNPGEMDRKYRVEIQLRTELQHLWSTAVEASSVIYDIDLKTEKRLDSVSGQERAVREFFAIVSSLFALEEGTTQVSGFDKPKGELVRELRRIEGLHRILLDLSSSEDEVYLSASGAQFNAPGFYLMRFATDLQFLDISYYRPEQLEKALLAYDDSETSVLKNGDAKAPINYDDVVLSYARDVEQLKLAFPNYSTRVGEFLGHVEKYL